MRAKLRPDWRTAGIVIAIFLAQSVAPSWADGKIVGFSAAIAPGTIVVRTGERRLYLVLGFGAALRYKVGVGRVGRQWTGSTVIDGKYIRPNWAPPDAVRRDKPGLPKLIASGAPENPMGEAALTLAGGEYAIHGTNVPNSIGGFVSYGCIRMYNSDIVDLYSRVSVGSPVLVTR
ncbi:L,D-transpeptidase [Mesorhizobium sp. ES1-1]|uniref:L,D-transpeptidase n=1 Tax=Mesorhizobium sp. ES1-1 TaxID=2876629 RepID=UPI001CCB82F1|nr:L,D-transpeptidase [Mesorhizobium sp. ES1-1]MBZ9675509.1 L,D-transpeptidase [Mesorhizobium sp. ES1-1]